MLIRDPPGRGRGSGVRRVLPAARHPAAPTARAAGSPGVTRLPGSFLEFMERSDGEGFIGFWEAAVRGELAAAPHLLD